MRPPDDAEPPLARVFLACMLGRELGARILHPVRESLGAAVGQHLRLYRPDDLHLTLVFLGPVRRERIDALARSVPACLPRVAPLELALGFAGAFPNRREPRVLWLALEARRAGALEDLGRVRDAVAELCRGQGFAVDPRPFVPHLTVARLRGGARPPEAFFEVDADQPWLPRRVALVETVSGAAQSAFRVLGEWPLPGAES
ncbi:MAG TPA: RNA 2',3'-cyclic phosphodiesterase [Planctomycetota bacterium]|nr:RNA 2',3'-cyclic phosphodiesterase [Planctomycetota bacterium]